MPICVPRYLAGPQRLTQLPRRAGGVQACESALFPVIRAMAGAARANASYIGAVGAGGVVECARGPEECAGDTQQLCALAVSADGATPPWPSRPRVCALVIS